MERKEYLERMKRAAVLTARNYASDEEEFSAVTVRFRGMTLFPVSYQLSYESDGETVRHTAVMRGMDLRNVYYARLAEVEAPTPPRKGGVASEGAEP